MQLLQQRVDVQLQSSTLVAIAVLEFIIPKYIIVGVTDQVDPE
jgi:hypothetical protein